VFGVKQGPWTTGDFGEYRHVAIDDRMRPYRLQTNGKAERLIQTALRAGPSNGR
jgi:hypothetical protein